MVRNRSVWYVMTETCSLLCGRGQCVILRKREEEVRQEGEMNAGMDSRNMSVSGQQHRQVHHFFPTTNCQINMLASTLTHGLLFV